MFKIFVIGVFVVFCSYIQVSESGSSSYIDLSSSFPYLSSEVADFSSEMLLEALSSVAPSTVSIGPTSLSSSSSLRSFELPNMRLAADSSMETSKKPTKVPKTTSSSIELSLETTTSIKPATLASKPTAKSATTAKPPKSKTKNPNQCHKCTNVFQFKEKPSACSCVIRNDSRRLKEVSNKERKLRGCCEDDTLFKDDKEDEKISQEGWDVRWHVKELGKAVARSLI